jgi:hypothetical protein
MKDDEQIKWERIGRAPIAKHEKYGIVPSTEDDSMFHNEMMGDAEAKLRRQARI